MRPNPFHTEASFRRTRCTLGSIGAAFGTEDGQQHPGYRDFAYVAFTIGKTYQVSDNTLRG